MNNNRVIIEEEEEDYEDQITEIKDIIKNMNLDDKKESLNKIINILNDNIYIVYGNLVIHLKKYEIGLKPIHVYQYDDNNDISNHIEF
jgi:hypothetical protein